MSFNLYCKGFGGLIQTPTDVTMRLLEAAGVGTVLEQNLKIARAYGEWVHATFDPPELQGKDARNPYLMQERDDEISRLGDHINALQRYIRLNSSTKLLFSYL